MNTASRSESRHAGRRGHRTARLFAGASLLAAALGGVAAQAQTAGNGVESLADIVVTAQRRSERLQDTPISVTAFSDAALAQKAVTNLTGIARFTPNIEISAGRADGGGSSLNAYIRGVGQQDFIFPTDPGVGLYVDDIYYARTIAGALDLSDVERIEVLRGPQGTLYGKNTIGGAIKIFTKRPDLEKWTGSIEGTTGRYNRSDFKGHVSGPLIDGVLGIKASLAALHRDGYGKRLITGEDLGDEGKLIGRLALRWKPSDRIDITIQGDYQRQRQNGPVGTMINRLPSDVDVSGLAGALAPAFPGAVDPTPQSPFLFDDFYNAFIVPTLNQTLGLPAGTRYDASWMTGSPRLSNGTDPSYDDNDVWGLSLAADFELSDTVTLKSITAYRDLDAKFPRDGDHTPYPVAATRNFTTQNQFSQELQLGGTAMGDKLKWLTGAYYMREKAFDNNKVNLFSGLYEVLSPVAPFLYAPGPCVGTGATADCTTNAFTFDYFPLNKIKVDTWAIFGQFTYDVTEKLSVTLGGRYSKDKKRYVQDHMLQLVADPKFGPGLPGYTGSTTPFAENGLARYNGPRTLKDSWGSFTPKVGIDYHITPDNLLYASWSKGFKGGGWSPRPTQQNNTDLAYDPEILSTFELGSKNSLMGGRVIVNLAAFYSTYKDVQVTTVGSSSTGALLLLTRNIGDAEIYGLEAEFTARPARGLELNAALGYLHSRWDKFNRSNCTAAVYDATNGKYCDGDLSLDDRLVDSPEWTLNLGAQYRFDLADTGALTLRGDASFKSKTWKDPYNLGGGVNYLGQTDIRHNTPSNGYYLITQPQMAQDAFWLVNLRVAWTDKTEQWEIAGAITNLTNKNYFTSMLPVNNFGYDEGYIGRPREWSLSVRYRF